MDLFHRFTGAQDDPAILGSAAGSFGPRRSILSTIGSTPVVRLNHIAPPHVHVYAKLEAFNPTGSVKDRMALAVIEAAERKGELAPGQTVIEATSGNTGIGLAMVCAQKGYPLVVVMGENFSVERRKLMRFLGAKVVLTPAAERGTGMVSLAERLAQAHGWFLCRQFENEANADIHSATTAREIMRDFANHQLDYWVTGFGTGGTLKGVARRLKAETPHTKVVVAEPQNSQILNSDVRQLRRPDGSAARSHPNARAHPIQGWSPDFVPKLAGEAMDDNHIDRFEPVSGHDALRTAGRLASREGILCGPSGGATVAAALAVAEHAENGTRILAMVPDTGERYLTTPLFHDVAEDMSEAEKAIAASVPPVRRRSKTAPDRPHEVDPAAAAFLDDVLGSQDVPVVMFGFEWCEFCWSIRRLCKRADIDLRCIDVDGAKFRENDWGGKVLRTLFQRTGRRTVPQVFVGGVLFGGAEDVLRGFCDGSFQTALGGLDTPIIPRPVHDAMALLPAWARRADPSE
ncbi:MAG: pyridoxal-phosphate dependent enzyme [Pseudomonadota bacterium]